MKSIRFAKSKVYYYNGITKNERLRPSYRANKKRLSIINKKVSDIVILYHYVIKIKNKIKMIFSLKEKYRVYANTSQNVLDSIYCKQL